MKKYKLNRGQMPALEFEGELLAHESSRDSEEQTHWAEIRIFRTSDGDWVTEQRGKSSIPRQRNKFQVYRCDTPEEVRRRLHRQKGDRYYLTDLALDALDAAIAQDPRLAPANEERI